VECVPSGVIKSFDTAATDITIPRCRSLAEVRLPRASRFFNDSMLENDFEIAIVGIQYTPHHPLINQAGHFDGQRIFGCVSNWPRGHIDLVGCLIDGTAL